MLLGKQKQCIVIAEISGNHGQKLDQALKLIEKAKDSGADAVKFQTYTPDTLTINAKNKYFQIKHPKWGNQTLYQLYERAYTPWKWFKKLKKAADDLEIIFFSTAFDRTAVDLLEKIRVPVHKVASFELVDLPLIEYMAKTKKPLIMSTGMATVSEIQEAVDTAKNAGANNITLLKCVSSYPAKPEQMNLRTILDMREKFKCAVGLSDHTLGTVVSTTAAALGAKVIEKHFTLSRKIETPDSFFSIEPKELKELVKNVRTTEKALGNTHYGLTKQEAKSKAFRRSLFVVEDMKKEEVFTKENVKSIRPANGLSPKFLSVILGKKAKRAMKRGTPLNGSCCSSRKKIR